MVELNLICFFRRNHPDNCGTIFGLLSGLHRCAWITDHPGISSADRNHYIWCPECMVSGLLKSPKLVRGSDSYSLALSWRITISTSRIPQCFHLIANRKRDNLEQELSILMVTPCDMKSRRTIFLPWARRILPQGHLIFSDSMYKCLNLCGDYEEK